MFKVIEAVFELRLVFAFLKRYRDLSGLRGHLRGGVPGNNAASDVAVFFTDRRKRRVGPHKRGRVAIFHNKPCARPSSSG
jgi:hypothetical protein